MDKIQPIRAKLREVPHWDNPCPNCGEHVELDDHGRVGYDSWSCDNCGRMWDDDYVHRWGNYVCRKCGEVLSDRAEGLAVNDVQGLCGRCS